jgi:prepilin-type processing-associated H-X9-DG protein
MAGFETTFLDGDASVGLRLPYVQQYGPAGFASQTVGDLSVLFKYAFLNNRATGDLASAGLVVTTPTGGGGNIVLVDGSAAPHSTLFQPWVGYVKVFESGYVQGIANLIVPTDSRDPTVFGKSLGAGYFLYQDASAPFLTAFIPRAEVHIRTPFNHRDPNGLVYFQDQVNVNGGATFRFGRAALNASVSVPVVGPRPWALEAISFLNVNF